MANLEIKIGAKDTASGVLNKLKSSFGSFSTGFSSIWGKLAGAFTAGAVLAKAKSTAAAIDDLKDRADNLKMPTDELQRWEFAANDAGLGSEKFGNAINKLNGLIQDTGKGGAAGLAAIEKLAAINLDPSQLKGKSFSDQMGLVFDALSKVTDKEKALAAASDIFGEKMGKNILGLAGSWRTLKDELSGEKIFTPEDIKAGEDFTKTMAQLDVTIQKLVTGSGLLQWLTKIAGVMDSIYNATPSKADLGTSSDKTSYLDVAESALRKTGKYQVNALVNDVNGASVPGMPYSGMKYETRDLPIPQADKEAWLDKNKPNWRNAESDKAAAEKINSENKLKQAIIDRAAEEKKANEQNLADTIKRLQANSDVQKLGEITGKPGLTQDDTDRLKAATDIKTRFEVEQQITAEKKKQIELAEKEKKKADAETDAKKSIQETIAALDEKRKEQDLINAGKAKEAMINAELARAKKEAKRPLTPEEKKGIANSAAALYDAQTANSFKGAQGSIVNDRFSAVGGMGGKLFSQDNTPKLHLAAAQQANKYLAAIDRGISKLEPSSGAMRAP